MSSKPRHFSAIACLILEKLGSLGVVTYTTAHGFPVTQLIVCSKSVGQRKIDSNLIAGIA